MRKTYPYLQKPYSHDIREALEAQEFAVKVNSALNQRQYVKITLLSWDERPIKEIQGVATSGTLTKDGTSSVRRTMSLSVNVDGSSYDVTSLDMDFSINKKVFVELGVKNTTGEFQDYPILWFPQGVFFINKMSLSAAATSAVSLSLNLRDKMSMLNGDVGGVLPAATIFDSVDTQSAVGQYVSEKVKVYEIIENAVNHFGGEDLDNIVIEDVDLQIRRVVRWNGENDLFLVPFRENGVLKYYTTSVDENDRNGEGHITIHQGDDCGYVYDDFVYTSDLSLSAGSKVTDLLDKIVSYLGNYEYFYDEYGIFHFREIKNYINTTFATTAIEDMTNNDYIMDTSVGKEAYAFSGESNIISISSSPAFDNIKNDYIVEGKRQSTVSDQSYPVRYHLAIDEKPRKTYLNADGTYSYEPRYGLVLYKDPDTGQTLAAFPAQYNSYPEEGSGEEKKPLPEIGLLNVIYFDKSFKHQEIGAKNSKPNYTYPEYENGKDDVGKPLYFLKKPIAYEKAESGEYAGYYIPSEFKQVYVNVDEVSVPKKTAAISRTMKVYPVEPLMFSPDGEENYTPEQTESLKNSKTYTYALDESTLVDPEYVHWTGEKYEILESVAEYKDAGHPYVPEDWRTELYLRGEYAKSLGTDKGYYYEELAAGWPQIYDLKEQKFIVQNRATSTDKDKPAQETCKSYADGNMFLDFIDAASSTLGEYSVNAIGRRTDVVVDDDVNCLFQPEIPDIVYVDGGLAKEERDPVEEDLTAKGEKWSRANHDIYCALATGGYKNGAFDRIKYELYLHTGYQRTLSITAIPAFYLEPNIRVSVQDKTSGTYGSYMVKSISYTLGTGTTMTVSASEIVERF